MKLPKRIKISGFDYEIRELPPEMVDDEGECDYDQHCISVRTTNRTDQFVANTLLHEVFHACFHEYGLGNIKGISHSKEELIINNLTNAFLAFVRDNPEVAKRIIKIWTKVENDSN